MFNSNENLFGVIKIYSFICKHKSVAVPRSIPLIKVLIYKEAARDQAHRPAGNPLRLEKVPIPGPVNIPGNIN